MRALLLALLLAACASRPPAPSPALDAAAAASLANGSPGVAVVAVRDGRVVVAEGWGVADLETQAPVTADTPFRLASVTKPFTAAVVLKLEEAGELSLDEPLARRLPEAPANAARATLGQLLTQTGGVPDFTEAPDYAARQARPHTPEQMRTWIGDLAPQFEPGTAWRYSNGGYVLVGHAISRVTDERLNPVYRRLLFAPAGVQGLAFEADAGPAPGQAKGYRRDKAKGFAPAAEISMTLPGAAGGLRGSARETALLADALFRGRLLGPEAQARFLAPGTLNDGRTTRWGMPDDWREGLQADYGHGLFHDVFEGRRRWSHAGDIDGFSTFLSHFPEERLTVVIFRNSESGERGFEAIQRAVLEELRRR